MIFQILAMLIRNIFYRISTTNICKEKDLFWRNWRRLTSLHGNIVHCGGIVVNVVIVILQEWVPKY